MVVIVVGWGGGVGKEGWGIEGFFWHDENVLKWIVLDGYTNP